MSLLAEVAVNYILI